MVQFLFHKEHAWVKWNGEEAVVGVSDFAQQAMGALLFAQLPGIGDWVIEDAPCGALESGKIASDIISPLTGLVTQVNQAVIDTPGLINEDAEASGWLFTMAPDRTSELSRLLDRDTYTSAVV